MANTPEDFYRDERFWDSTASALTAVLRLERQAVDHLTHQNDLLKRELFAYDLPADAYRLSDQEFFKVVESL